MGHPRHRSALLHFRQYRHQRSAPITHPLFYYGFAGVALAWQFIFLVIGSNPVRFRPLMLVGILEKVGYFVPALVLYNQHRVHIADVYISSGDGLLAVLFLMAYFKTPAEAAA